jgi:hypothetical protein
VDHQVASYHGFISPPIHNGGGEDTHFERIFVELVPSLVFTNLFAMFFLEILSSTKPAVGKEALDLKLGNWVNSSITGIFFVIFAFIASMSSKKGNNSTV